MLIISYIRNAPIDARLSIMNFTPETAGGGS